MLRTSMYFYGDELLAPRPTLKLENHPLSAIRDFLLNILIATFHIGGRSSIRNPRNAVAQSVEALRYKPEGRGFDPRWCNWKFSLT
jgi:hypothetical protein